MPSNEPGPRARHPRRAAANEPGFDPPEGEPYTDSPAGESYPDSPGGEPYLGDQEEELDQETLESDPSSADSEDSGDPGDPGAPDGPDDQPSGADLDSMAVSFFRIIQDAAQRAMATDRPAPERPFERDRVRIALQYDVLRATLGRPQADVMVLYRVAGRQREGSGRGRIGIRVTSGSVSDGNWIVLYGNARDEKQSISKIGGAEYRPDSEGTVWIPVTVAHPRISRLEVWNREHGQPIRLGCRVVDDTRYNANPARR